jgi:hypothetical protein
VFLAKIVKSPNGKPPREKHPQKIRPGSPAAFKPILPHNSENDTSINSPAFLGQPKQLLVRFLHILYRFDRFSTKQSFIKAVRYLLPLSPKEPDLFLFNSIGY